MAYIRVIQLGVASLALQEMLEFCFGARWAYFPCVSVVVFEGQVLMLGFSNDCLGVGSRFEGAIIGK